jgi:hypothetical protein
MIQLASKSFNSVVYQAKCRRNKPAFKKFSAAGDSRRIDLAYL